MKISKERFEELVSLYLDGEASEDELSLLSLCVRENPQMAGMFFRACRVHAATCAMYGKEAHFGKLDGVDFSPLKARRAATKNRIIAEWAAVAVLMLLSFTLFIFAIIPPKQANNALLADRQPCPSAYHYPDEDYEVSIAATAELSSDGTILSVIRMSPKHRNP